MNKWTICIDKTSQYPYLFEFFCSCDLPTDICFWSPSTGTVQSQATARDTASLQEAFSLAIYTIELKLDAIAKRAFRRQFSANSSEWS